MRILIVICLICVYLCLSAYAQRRPATDYSKFSHATEKHRAACNTCHKPPTKDWNKVSSFPDVADYPDHDACVSCHRPQFFRGAKPPICSVCHSKTSPKDEVRFAFRKLELKRQFDIEFPHDRHQDAIALLRFAHPPQNYYNCTVCHTSRNTTFKAAPTDHASCFNCHWKSQQPVATNCNGCHKLAQTPYVPNDLPSRISAKFIHEGGGQQKAHLLECATCHINITKSASSQGLKPDVPITACTECHNKDGLRQDLIKELTALGKNREFVCSYCHTPNVGNRDAPASHYMIVQLPPLKRKDIK